MSYEIVPKTFVLELNTWYDKQKTTAAQNLKDCKSSHKSLSAADDSRCCEHHSMCYKSIMLSCKVLIMIPNYVFGDIKISPAKLQPTYVYCDDKQAGCSKFTNTHHMEEARVT